MNLVRDSQRKGFVVAIWLFLLPTLPPVPSGAQEAGRLFPETGKKVSGRFLAYWETHGRLARQGFPISEEMQERSDTDGKIYVVQYFERAVFESHPENSQPNDVLLSLLGSFAYREKYPGGAPGQGPNGAGSHFFAETGKRVGGLFLDYWQRNGGLKQFGYPISDEFRERSDLDGKSYTVQYFERAVFEAHPENVAPYDVLLSQLGTFRYRVRQAQASGPRLTRLAAHMILPRACHSATLLPNGKVLIAGGMQRDGVITSSAELFDPATGAFSPASTMAEERACHSATALGNGKVLIAGSYDATSAELYDPATGVFAPTGSLHYKRDGFAATLLRNGKVLITDSSFDDPGSPAELYDPASGTFGLTGRTSVPRFAHTATLLEDGKVLVAGGSSGNRAGSPVLSSAEIYDPLTGAFNPTGSMSVARHKHAAIPLPDGRVLVAGGADSRDWRGRYASAEIYDPRTGAFIPTGSMSAARFKFSNALAVLDGGNVLLGGGGASVDIYNPASGAFTAAQDTLDAARFYASATRLPDGRVLIAGGYDTNISGTARAWVYKP
ncbi:MAG: Kelch repeat-containing protein [Chloroflexia bacterium]